MRYREPVIRVMVPPGTDSETARVASPLAKAAADRLRVEGSDASRVFEALDILLRWSAEGGPPPDSDLPPGVGVQIDDAAQTRALEEMDRLATEYEKLAKLWFSVMAGMMVYQQLKAEGRSPDFIDEDDLARLTGWPEPTTDDPPAGAE